MNEIEEYEDINLRVLFMLQSIMEATSLESNDQGISVKGMNGDETVPFTTLQSTSGPQTTNGSESVDSGDTQVIQNVESSTGDVSQPLHNSAPSADAGFHATHSPKSSGTNLQLSTNSNINTVTSPNYANPMATQPRPKLLNLVLPKFKGDGKVCGTVTTAPYTPTHNSPRLINIITYNRSWRGYML